MILIDYSQLAISVFLSTPELLKDKESLKLSRHFILNMLRAYKKKYSSKYGEMVICCDSSNVWRRDIFPQYKHSRKVSRDNSDFDWGKVFEYMAIILEEIKTFMPYPVIKFDRLEADDIIGILIIETNRNYSIDNDKNHLIVSSDKDHLQLMVYGNVYQYSPLLKKMINKGMKFSDVHHEMVLQYIHGDKGDGIPNIFSDDNVFVEGKRQSSVTKKKLEEIFKHGNVTDDYLKIVLGDSFKNYQRNKTLISYGEIPSHFSEMVMQDYESQKNKPKDKIFNYLVNTKCIKLLSDIGDF